MSTKSKRLPDQVNIMNARLSKRPIAIVGMAALFPDAPNLYKYWDNIVNKIEKLVYQS